MEQLTVEEINEQVKGVDTNLVSDGYHTFGELYDHRISLFIAVCKMHFAKFLSAETPANEKRFVWRSKAHSDGSVWDGWFILGIGILPGEQITYHLPTSRWEECDCSISLDKAPEWDGHTSADVLERLKTL